MANSGIQVERPIAPVGVGVIKLSDPNNFCGEFLFRILSVGSCSLGSRILKDNKMEVFFNSRNQFLKENCNYYLKIIY